MTTKLEDDLRDWMQTIPVSDAQLRRLETVEYVARRRGPSLGQWAATVGAVALLVGMAGIAFIALSRAPSVGPSNADGPVAIETQDRPNDICEAAGVGGTLVADPTYGLALQRLGYTSGAIWPFGYSARRVSGRIVLYGPSGNVVAHEGDQILAAGAAGPDGADEIECQIHVNGVQIPD
jgi:hypothetical protein